MKNKKLSIEVTRYLERELKDYEKNIKYLKELEEDIIFTSPNVEVGMPINKGFNEQLTGKVIKLINNQEIKRLKKIIEQIYKVLQKLNDFEYEIYTKYFKNQQSVTKISIDKYISVKSVYRIRNKIIYMLAEELGFC